MLLLLLFNVDVWIRIGFDSWKTSINQALISKLKLEDWKTINNLVVGAPSADMHEGQVDVGMSYLYSMVPDAPTELNVQAGTSKVTAVKWTTPLSNAAPITKYFVTATPVSRRVHRHPKVYHLYIYNLLVDKIY